MVELSLGGGPRHEATTEGGTSEALHLGIIGFGGKKSLGAARGKANLLEDRLILHRLVAL